jgi:cell division protein FtsN
MPTMVTFRAGGAVGSALLAALVVPLGGCSREQQDWHAAQSAATPEAYEAFIEQHPDSELVRQARLQIADFAEDREWQLAVAAGTQTAYQTFLAQHPTGRRAEEARIRIEGFSLGSAPRMAHGESPAISQLQGTTGVKLLQLNAAAASHAAPTDESGAHAENNTAVANTAANIRVATAAAAAAAAAPASPGMPAGDTYAVQLGAFGTEASASAEWARLQARFGPEFNGLSPHIVSAGTPAGRLYRLQVPTSDEAQARAICASLKQQWQACFAVPAEPH